MFVSLTIIYVSYALKQLSSLLYYFLISLCSTCVPSIVLLSVIFICLFLFPLIVYIMFISNVYIAFIINGSFIMLVFDILTFFVIYIFCALL
jgi:hypothetical protein